VTDFATWKDKLEASASEVCATTANDCAEFITAHGLGLKLSPQDVAAFAVASASKAGMQMQDDLDDVLVDLRNPEVELGEASVFELIPQTVKACQMFIDKMQVIRGDDGRYRTIGVAKTRRLTQALTVFGFSCSMIIGKEPQDGMESFL